MNNTETLKQRNNNKKNKDGIKAAFLLALSQGYSVTFAAKAAHIGRVSCYRWRKEDPKFASCWDDAHEQGIDWFEDRLHDAAVALNVTAILAKLNAYRPNLYRHPSKVEVTGIIKHAHHDVSKFNEKELDSLLEFAKRYSGGEGETASD